MLFVDARKRPGFWNWNELTGIRELVKIWEEVKFLETFMLLLIR